MTIHLSLTEEEAAHTLAVLARDRRHLDNLEQEVTGLDVEPRRLLNAVVASKIKEANRAAKLARPEPTRSIDAPSSPS